MLQVQYAAAAWDINPSNVWFVSKRIVQQYLGLKLKAETNKEERAVQHDVQTFRFMDATSNYNLTSLHTATFQLADFGRAVLYKQLAAEPGSLLTASPPLQEQQQLLMRQGADAPVPEKMVVQFAAKDRLELQPAPYDLDGGVILTDPCLRPPEEILGLPYAAPPYDIWRLGCLLAELAVGIRLFGATEIAKLRLAYPQSRYHKDDALLLMGMQPWLGTLPRTFVRSSPRFKELYQPNDVLRLANAFELKPTAVSIPMQVESNCLARRLDANMSEVNEFQSMVMSMLAYDPAKRPSAAELLQHMFLQQQQQQQQ